jgi:hypothetical protein
MNPIYWAALGRIPSEELLYHRGIWTALTLGVILGYAADSDVDLNDLVGEGNWVSIRTITYQPMRLDLLGASYELVLSNPGDNLTGGIVRNNQRVAEVGDGSIFNCSVESYPHHNDYFTTVTQPSPADKKRFAGDYFGRNLADLERMRQFAVTPRMASLARCFDEASCAAVRANYVIANSYDSQDFLLQVENDQGVLVTKNAPHMVVARIKHGNILDARASFHAYDKLPWFYSN